MNPSDRRRLREALRSSYPWVDETDWGPAAVEAGECDRCRSAPRLVPTCGPLAWTTLCRGCALDLREEMWCEGHRDQRVAILAAVRRLPLEWATVTVLYWVSTGEVRPQTPAGRWTGRLPPAVLATLPGPAD